VKISDEVLQACIDQSERMLPDRSFPDKAIDLMDESASKTRMECIVDEKTECQIVPEVKIEDVHKIAEEYKEVKS
jgi:ATP-dependent Clp protease ATP-binding subunit ClpC